MCLGWGPSQNGNGERAYRPYWAGPWRLSEHSQLALRFHVGHSQEHRRGATRWNLSAPLLSRNGRL